MARVHAERSIAASLERVFDWLLDPANLTVSPVVRKAVWARGSSGPGVGAVREVTGFGFWVHERITAYDAPRSFAYVVVGSFPASQHEGGTLTCNPSGEGTHVEWVSGYTVPARGGGKVIENNYLRCEVVSAPTVHHRLPPPMRHRSGCAVSR